MALYTPPTLSGYNSSPPSDDGSTTASNQVKWSTIKTKLGDPLSTYMQAIDTRVSAVLTTNALDVDGNVIVLDSDGDTKIGATTDDQILVTIANATAGGWNASGLSVGTSTSSAYLTVQATSAAAGYFEWSDDTATVGPTITLHRESSSPAASDDLGQIRFTGINSASATVTYASHRVEIQDTTSTAETGRHVFYTTVSGTLAERVRIGNGLYTPNATGGDRGADTINASNVYDDGSLLTCYVLEAWQDGVVTPERWDATTVDGSQHGRARSFSQVASDRLDLDKFADYLKTQRHLPAFPAPDRWESEWEKKMPIGEMGQRLWETIELLAVHVVTLHERVKTLEGGRR